MDLLTQIIQKSNESGGRLTVKSALNPLLWFCAVVDIPFLIVFAIFVLKGDIPEWILKYLFFVICAPVICTIACAIYLLFFDRDKLQSEDFQIKKRSLELIEQKGDSFPKIATQELLLINKPVNKVKLLKKKVRVNHG